jgi:hypothetical protein
LVRSVPHADIIQQVGRFDWANSMTNKLSMG